MSGGERMKKIDGVAGTRKKKYLKKVRNEYFMVRMESFPQFNTAERVITVNFTTSKLGTK
jgi:hypothetical protein